MHSFTQGWRQWFSAVGKVVTGTAALTGASCVGFGGYGAHMINQPRQRWFSDNFTLTPETLRLPFKKIGLETSDPKGRPVHLDGWFIEQTVRGEPSKKLVLCCCPFNHDKSTLLGVARGLWDHGYSVLLFDFRSFAREETHQTIGYLEHEDGKVALEWLKTHKPEGGKIGILGCSMGGAVSLMLSSEEHQDVVACATDCAFSCLKDVIKVRLDKMFPITRVLGLNQIYLESICLVNRLYYGYDPAKVGPRGRLSDIDIPLLIVHSEKDSVVPLEQGFEIYQKAGSKDKSFFVVKDAEHIESFFLDQKDYVRRIVTFFDQHFKHENSIGAVFLPGHELLLNDNKDHAE